MLTNKTIFNLVLKPAVRCSYPVGFVHTTNTQIRGFENTQCEMLHY